MNKKLLAIAVGAALSTAPMFASAGVKVYGHAQVEVGTVDNGTTSATEVRDQARGRIGIKAKEKLGNGMTAIAKFEFKTDTTDGNVSKCSASSTSTTTLTNGNAGETAATTTTTTCKGNAALSGRELMIGLKGGFGTVQAGQLKSAYKYTGGVKYDPFAASMLEARGANGMSKGELGNAAFGHNSFLANSVGYKSPKMNGFSAWATWSPDEKGASNGSDGDYSFSLKFKQKGWEVFVAGVNNDTQGSSESASGSAIKFGGMYKFGNFKVVGQYEQLDLNGTSNDIDIYFIGGQAKFGNNVVVAQFGNKDTDNGASLDYYTIGLIHNLSKKTRLTAGFRNRETSATAEEDIFAVGMRMKF